jgi:cytochrome P450
VLWQTAAVRTRPVKALQRARRRYGQLFTVGLAPVGRLVAVCEPSAALRVLEQCPRAGQANAATLPVALIDVQAIALTWAFECLARQPDMAARLRAAAAAGDTTFPGNVADEILRTRPPIIGAFRTLDAPFDLDGTRLPAGTRVMAAIPVIHQDPGGWPDPGAFRPERFLAGQPPGWLPFGAGARRCLGADLARFTMRTVITAVTARTRLRPARPRGETAWLAGTALLPSRLGTVIREGQRPGTFRAGRAMFCPAQHGQPHVRNGRQILGVRCQDWNLLDQGG